MYRLRSIVEDDRLSWHVPVDYAKFLGLGRPGNIVDGAFLVWIRVSVKLHLFNGEGYTQVDA